jgi:hypothetical protein
VLWRRHGLAWPGAAAPWRVPPWPPWLSACSTPGTFATFPSLSCACSSSSSLSSGHSFSSSWRGQPCSCSAAVPCLPVHELLLYLMVLAIAARTMPNLGYCCAALPCLCARISSFSAGYDCIPCLALPLCLCSC